MPLPVHRVVTIREVAQAAGVSISTASRALGEGSASAKTREKVNAAAQELGYIPNPAARQLSTGKTNTVAILVAEPPDYIFNDPFLSMLVSQLAVALSSRGLLGFLVLADPENANTFGSQLRRVGVDGVMVASFHPSSTLERSIRSLQVPVMFVGRPSAEFGDYPYVDVDNFRGGFDAGKRIVSIGRVRVAQIAGPKGMSAAQDREAGFVSALRNSFCKQLDVDYGSFTLEHGSQGMARILRKLPDVDGIFAHSDQIAAGAMHVLAESGRRVPEDVAVIGFDDSSMARATNPPLTTLRQPVGDMAHIAVDMMADLLSGQGGVMTKQLLLAPLKIRGSA